MDNCRFSPDLCFSHDLVIDVFLSRHRVAAAPVESARRQPNAVGHNDFCAYAKRHGLPPDTTEAGQESQDSENWRATQS